MRCLFSFIFLVVTQMAYSQEFIFKINGQDFTIEQLSAVKFNQPVKNLSIKTKEPVAGMPNFKVQDGNETFEFKADGTFKNINFANDIRTSSIAILTQDDEPVGEPIILSSDGRTTGTGGNQQNVAILLPKESASQFIFKQISNTLHYEPDGIKIYNSKQTGFSGKNYIHLFFDQNGNSLVRSIPVGISGAQYVVHIIYLVPVDNPLSIDYKVNQAPADVEEGVIIQGDGGLADAIIVQSKKGNKPEQLKWMHYEFLLTGSSKDIRFDIVRNSYQLQNGSFELADPRIVATRTIKMKKVYHGSVDIGIVETRLANPSFSLVDSDVDPSQKVVKRTNNGRRIMATAMYTFYLSPVIALQKLFNPKSVENNRVMGRNFVNDHGLLQRIYPTVGIGLNDRLLDNVFLGGKWEFIRGGSFFAGYHRGKVNVMITKPDFKFSETYISEATFELNKDTRWKGAFVMGLNLDVRVITNLFQRNSTGSGEE